MLFHLPFLSACVSNQLVGQAELLFSDVLNSLGNLAKGKSGSSMIIPESRHRITDLEGMLQKEKSEFEVCNKFQILRFIFTAVFMAPYILYLFTLIRRFSS